MSAESFAAALSWLRSRMDGAAQATSPTLPASFVTLAERFGLTPFEQQILLLCTAMELDPEMPSRCQQIHGVPYPTFSLAFRVFDAPSWEAISPSRPLRHWRLIEINQPGALPLMGAALRTDERITAYLNGVNVLDDRLQTLTAPIDASPAALSDSQQQAAERLVAAWRARPSTPICITGDDAASIQTAVALAARSLDLALIRVPVAWLPPDGTDVDQLARLLARERHLLPIAVLIDAHDAAPANPDRSAALDRLLANDVGTIALSARDARAGMESIDVSRPTRAEQYDEWRTALGDGHDDTARRLAGQFNLSVMAIRQLAEQHRNEGNRDAAVWRAVLNHARPRLDQLAARIDVRASWRDLILPKAERKLLYTVVRHAAQRQRVYDEWGFRRTTSRGLGIAALFAGESGTGKTMAAEVLAGHLALNLYRIDLSAVVSKYIGETEKNLRRVFDAAEDGGAILFFDEADALFGKRSEVRDSHDRYANVEINYLLQRIESFSGLSILSTNLKSAIDPAFLRRLRFVVNFPFPDALARRRIWERAFPREAPVERKHPLLRLDVAALARLNLTGGSIHNIAVNSAFLAATRGGRITWPIVLDAARNELRKLDRPISEIDRSIAARREVVVA